ncbi:hypothetical protein LPTSP3_g30950 [Leptospira kobayashii]|uniref:pEK499-p136 HEPN domain-containing protein n=1 Tax=Leptospira kobayashii TaxID=1917830 RepID=A0ABN6KG50_9LEPT|nr:hypothetical protein [Leptospira kobayashii]BDA80165.1 hypothetical protein LPTSP3_g30950 [Leptospira kobayashii]
MNMIFSNKIAKHDFFDTAVADILRAIDGGSLMGSIILSMCCIDYMGLAMNPEKKNTKSDFKNFITEHMSQANTIYSDPDIADVLYAVRNSLIHSYGKSDATENLKLDFVIDQNRFENHLAVVTSGNRRCFYLYLPHFVAELIAGVEHFFRKSAITQASLHKWYSNLLLVLGVSGSSYRFDVEITPGNIHSRSHRFLEVLDNPNPLSIESLRENISLLIRKQLNPEV